MQVLDLFSGIGGASLGLHWAGMRTIAFCEQDAFATTVLRRHWPSVPIYPDIRALTFQQMQTDGLPQPELLVGGFPCQDISLAGRGAGLAGARSGLWSHMVRLVAECRPRWVVAENVPGLRSRGADQVCSDLEKIQYAVWPLLVGAVHAGAPHKRQRIWLLAHDTAAHPPGPRLEMGQPSPTQPPPVLPPERCGGWPPEPGLRRVGDGVPARGGPDKGPRQRNRPRQRRHDRPRYPRSGISAPRHLGTPPAPPVARDTPPRPAAPPHRSACAAPA